MSGNQIGNLVLGGILMALAIGGGGYYLGSGKDSRDATVAEKKAVDKDLKKSEGNSTAVKGLSPKEKAANLIELAKIANEKIKLETTLATQTAKSAKEKELEVLLANQAHELKLLERKQPHEEKIEQLKYSQLERKEKYANTQLLLKQIAEKEELVLELVAERKRELMRPYNESRERYGAMLWQYRRTAKPSDFNKAEKEFNDFYEGKVVDINRKVDDYRKRLRQEYGLEDAPKLLKKKAL